MPFPLGNQVYDTDVVPVYARGIEFTPSELEHALVTYVTPLVYDQAGTEELEALLSTLTDTDFEVEGLRRILDVRGAIDDWRVGEAIAEAYLINHCECEFPWPTNRDLRNPNASPAGCDLVGFQRIEGIDQFRFAFGEVKTSSEERWPPQVANSRNSGIEKQIEDLIGDTATKLGLVRYIAMHAPQKPWYFKFAASCKRYFSNRNDVSLYGFLIRDVEVKVLDLKARADSLSKKCTDPISIQLRAVYLPSNHIEKLAQVVSNPKVG